jgi:hypothetical protein
MVAKLDKVVQVRMSKDLHQYIARKAKRLGFRNVSEYIRHIFQEQRMQETEFPWNVQDSKEQATMWDNVQSALRCQKKDPTNV